MSTQAPARTRGGRMVAPLGTLVGVVGAWAAVVALRPDDAGPTPCPFRALTGLDCPFCGSTRAAASLGGGDLVAALDHNAFFVLAILPLAAVAWMVWTRQAWRGRPVPVLPTSAVLAVVVLTGAWWAIRLAVPWLGSAAAA